VPRDYRPPSSAWPRIGTTRRHLCNQGHAGSDPTFPTGQKTDADALVALLESGPAPRKAEEIASRMAKIIDGKEIAQYGVTRAATVQRLGRHGADKRAH